MNDFGYAPGTIFCESFETFNTDTGLLANADAPPTITAFVNGIVYTIPGMTVLNPSTGFYFAKGVIPAQLNTGDVLTVRAQAVIATKPASKVLFNGNLNSPTSDGTALSGSFIVRQIVGATVFTDAGTLPINTPLRFRLIPEDSNNAIIPVTTLWKARIVNASTGLGIGGRPEYIGMTNGGFLEIPISWNNAAGTFQVTLYQPPAVTDGPLIPYAGVQFTIA